jgi:undecaprenyl-diphosphatase
VTLTATQRTAAPDRAIRRFPRDGLIIIGGLSVVAVGAGLRAAHLADAELDVFETVNHLTGAIHLPVESVMMAGTLIAVPVAALIALVLRRYRLALLLAAGGVLAYLLARVAKVFVQGGRPLDVLPRIDVVVRGAPATGLGYPSGHSAVSVALALIVIPYLSSRWRWAWLLVPLVVGFARMYVGAHLPLDVVGGWGIGAASAFAIHLAFGRPRLRERDATVERRASEIRGDPAAAAR